MNVRISLVGLSILLLSGCLAVPKSTRQSSGNGPGGISERATVRIFQSATGRGFRYQTSAEVLYEDIAIEDGRLTFTTDDGRDCSNPAHPGPCWTNDTLITTSRSLVPTEVSRIDKAIAMASQKLSKDVYGDLDPDARAYEHTLTLRQHGVDRTIVYRSSPDAEPMPTAFSDLVNVARTIAFKHTPCPGAGRMP